MKKNKLFMAIATLFLVMAFTVVGGTTSEAAKTKFLKSGKFCYKVLPKNKLELIGTKQEKGTLVIPAYVTYKGKKYTVTRIADCFDITADEIEHEGQSYDLNLPGTHDYYQGDVSRPKYWTRDNFMDMDDLEISKVIFPSTLTYIGEGTFLDYHLKKVVFAKKYKKLTIGKNAFGSLKKITFPEGTYELKENAAGQTSEIYIPASVKKIGPGVVNNWTKKVTISKKNKKFKMKDGILYSFDEKKLISASAKVKKSVKISSKTKSIGKKAFAETKIEKVKLNKNITTIPQGAFARCFNLKKITNIENIKEIGAAAFLWCENYNLGKMPKLEEIGEDAFLYGGKVNLTISSKMKIHNRAFACEGYYESDDITIAVAENDSVYSIVNGLLIKKDGEEQIVMLQVSDSVNLVVPEGVTQIPVSIGSENLESIEFPSTLKVLYGQFYMKQKEFGPYGEGKVYFKSMTAPKVRIPYGRDEGREIAYGIGHIYVPKGTIEAYKEAIEATACDTTYFNDEVTIEEY